MGIDFVCWKYCPLQEWLGYAEHTSAMKLPGYLEAAKRMATDQLDTIEIEIKTGSAPPTSTSFAEISERVEQLASDVPACANCLRSSGRQMGCYHVVSYPIDEEFERLLFNFFTSQLLIPDSVCQQLYLDVVSKIPGEGTSWHVQRGPESVPKLSRLAEALRTRLGEPFRAELDSAQLLEAVFRSPHGVAEVVAYARFWHEFEVFVEGVTHSRESITLQQALGLDSFFQLAVVDALESGAEVFVNR